jgi:hypothetical protein
VTDRYLSEFERLREPPDAAGMIRHMSQLMDDHQGSLHQRDDITLLCVNAGETAGVISAAEKTAHPISLRAS